MYEYKEAVRRMRLGATDRELGRERVIGRKKAAGLRAIATGEGWLDATQPLPNEAQIHQALKLAKSNARTKPSSLAPWQETIQTWHAQGVQGVAIHAALVRNHGFNGHYSAVRRLLRKLRDREPIAPTMILEFGPGEAGQVDFGAGPWLVDPAHGEPRRTWFFVMTLCFSRHQYVEFVRDQTVQTWLRCHQHAFNHFGGVVRRLIIDNPKCAITRATIDDPQVQRAYAECAQGWGFQISPCPPADPQKKGRVEAGVKFVKRNFLPLRTFRDLEDLNRQAHGWVMDEAGQRIHGSTRQSPLTLFETERAMLLALPERPPEVCVWAEVTVHRDTHVQFDRCLYSLPYALIGQQLWLRATSAMVQVFDAQHLLVASHVRGTKPGGRSTVDDHLPPAARAWKMRTPQFCLEQAERVGPACLALVRRLFGDRVLDRLRSVQGLLRLVDTYSASRLEAACVRIGEVDFVSARTVRTMLERGLDRIAVPAPTPAPNTPAYQGQGRFSAPRPPFTLQ
jgi:transposase